MNKARRLLVKCSLYFGLAVVSSEFKSRRVYEIVSFWIGRK